VAIRALQRHLNGEVPPISLITRRRAPATAGLLGLTFPVVLALLALLLGLEIVVILIVTAAAFIAAGVITASRAPHLRWRSVLVLTIPTAVVFVLMAINTRSLSWFAVPLVALLASAAGEGIGRRIRESNA
jgi:hypothetical protein